jgi:polar amino acid transport system substrate-binding protein
VRCPFAAILASLACACAGLAGAADKSPSTPPLAASMQARAELAPGGKLRAAINFGNPILAVRDAASGEPRGLSVDLARELARRLGVPVELVLYSAAGKVVDGRKAADWDVGFVAIDPTRAVDMDFSAPYVIIEGSYLVPSASTIGRNEEVDRDGIRVVVGRGSAYDLYLSRELQHAKLVQAPTSPAVSDMMMAQSFEVAAGVRQQLEADAKRIAGVRLLPGRFMVIRQAMAIGKSRPAGLQYLAAFVEEMKVNGFVASALARHGVDGVDIAPPAEGK